MSPAALDAALIFVAVGAAFSAHGVSRVVDKLQISG